MTQFSFTEAAVKKLKAPAEGQDQYFEKLKKGLTLGLYISYGGQATWRALYYVNGKPRSKGIGSWPDMPVATAKETAYAFVPKGIDARTFEAVSELWFKQKVEKRNLRTAGELQRIIDRYILPAWGNTKIFDIDRKTVNALLDEIEKKNGVVMCDHVLSVITSIMRWYMTRDDKYASPIVQGMQRDERTPAERKRARTLNDAEIRHVWKASDQMGVFGAFMKLCLLTAQRRGRVAEMKHADIEDGIWALPVLARAKGDVGRVRLPPLALDIIENQTIIEGNPHVLAVSGEGHVHTPDRYKQQLDKLLPASMPPWVIHDLRRTARTLMSRVGVDRFHAELVMGHTQAGVAGTYDRFEYFDEKSDALQKVNDLITQILKHQVDSGLQKEMDKVTKALKRA